MLMLMLMPLFVVALGSSIKMRMKEEKKDPSLRYKIKICKKWGVSENGNASVYVYVGGQSFESSPAQDCQSMFALV